MFLYITLFLRKLTIQDGVLGRWCHISMPKCCQKTIYKKIDFANQDNSF